MLAIITAFILVFIFLGVLRLLYIIPFPRSASERRQRFHAASPRLSSKDAGRKHHHVLIVLGSGGHTTEMLDLLPCMDTSRIVHRSYVFSSGDAYSATLARTFEEQLAMKKKGVTASQEAIVDIKVCGVAAPPQEEEEEEDVDNNNNNNVDAVVRDKDEFVIVDAEEEGGDVTAPAPAKLHKPAPPVLEEGVVEDVPQSKLRKPAPKTNTDDDEKPAYDLREIPRARRVGQSWLSTPWTCLVCLYTCLSIVRGDYGGLGWPSLIICNGPGTAVMVAAASYVFRYLGLSRTKIVYVESFTRVTNLSLSGLLLWPFADRFLVQWPELAQKYRGVELLELVDGVKPGSQATSPAVS